MTGPRSFDWCVTSHEDPGARDDYRDSFEGLYEISELDLGDRDHFFNRTRMTLFGAGTVGHGQSNSQTLRRSRAQARRNGFEAISLVVANGPVRGEAGERGFSGAAGSVIFLDLTKPSRSRWSDLHLINLVIPRDLAPRNLVDGDPHGLSLKPESGAGRLIGNHLRTLSEVASGLSDAQGRAAIEAAMIMAQIALGGTPEVRVEHRQAIYRTVRERASYYLEPRLLDPELTAVQIAKACAVSRATLYRAFGAESGLMRHLQRRRLDLARQALAARVDRKPSIADIADHHGFASPAHFSRAFRERFGISPSEVPPLHPDKAKPGRTSAIRLDAVVDWLKEAAA